MKTFAKRCAEGRCRGIGADYRPFITAREAHSRGVASDIWDPIEGRAVSCLSKGEQGLYYTLRWNPDVMHIREQYLLNDGLIKAARKKLQISSNARYYTTDFLIDYRDGSQKAFSFKENNALFDPTNKTYEGRPKKYRSFIDRQAIEAEYWRSQGVDFAIVTKEDLNPILIKNVSDVMSCYDPLRCVSTEQKLQYLIAHRIVSVPMDRIVLDYKKLAALATFDIDAMYDHVLQLRRNAEEWLMN